MQGAAAGTQLNSRGPKTRDESFPFGSDLNYDVQGQWPDIAGCCGWGKGKFTIELMNPGVVELRVQSGGGVK